MGGRYKLSGFTFQCFACGICGSVDKCVSCVLLCSPSKENKLDNTVWESVFCISCKGLWILFQKSWVCTVLLTSTSATIPVSVRCLKTRRPILYWEETKVAEGRSSGLINPISVATLSCPIFWKCKSSNDMFSDRWQQSPLQKWTAADRLCCHGKHCWVVFLFFFFFLLRF